MATSTLISTPNKMTYDEILSTTSLLPIDETDNIVQVDYDLTNYLLFIFPFYICAILLNFLSIYSILIAKIYRQYLSNVLLAVICIGSLINIHGQIFLILLRWTNNSSSNQLCSSSIYLRDSGSILIHTHIFFLVFERILANFKKNPTNLNNNIIQKAHFFLIFMSLISIILSLTVPIYTLKHSSFSPFDGLCIPLDTRSYKKYLDWIYYGFGHPLLWSSCILLVIFLFRKTTISYSTLIPMNRITLIISLFSCINLLIQTLFDDIIGIGNERILNVKDVPSEKMFYLMNFRDLISLIHKILIGILFFVFRPEIRLWLYESMKKFQLNKKEIIIPQMLDIRNELDENYDEIDDGNLHFRADI
jgi:hypothetical protein